MTAEDCQDRAACCAANAALAVNEDMARDFLKLAAQWRAMAVRQIFLGHVEPAAPFSLPEAPTLLG